MDRFYLRNKSFYLKLVNSFDGSVPAPHFSRHTTTAARPEEDTTRDHPNLIISARVRPMLEAELAEGFPCAAYARVGEQPNEAQIVDVHDLYNHPRGRPELRSSKYRVDGVFDAEASTEEIYQEFVSDLVSFAKSGGIATLLAYGQTGSGKTYTISQLQRLVAMSLMDEASTSDNQTEIFISISDLSGNSAFDLLDSRRPVPVLQDSSGVTHLAGAKEYRIEDIDQVLELLDQSASYRRTESTKKNNASSRSHSICQLRIKNPASSNRPADDGILYLVDLAGSEAARDVAEHGADRMRETKEINISLSVLKDCLRRKAEVEIARREGREKKVHVPIRRSTLTRVLKHVFDPEESRLCKTVVIACVNPNLADVGPSKNTLRYAEMLGQVGGRQKAAA